MRWTYRPALDGLRSVAVYLVLLFHAGLVVAGGGFIGVDLFFVLSGFLVSNVILSELDETGRLRLGRFYARRVRRLLPAALVVIVATSAMFLLIASVVRRLPIVVDAQSALLYVANWRFLFQQNDYFAADIDASPFLHFWSLAIEEQFYVVFPILLVLGVRAARRRSWILPAVVGGLFVLSLSAQLYWAQTDVSWAYYGTDARLYQLLAGVLLALGLRTSWRPSAVVASAAAPVGLVLLLLLGSGLLSMTPSWRGMAATLASVLAIGGLMTADSSVFARLLSRRTPVYLGQISYGTYLWHWPVILVIQELLAVGPVVLAVLAVALSSGLAALSFQVLEHPIRSAPRLGSFRWRVVGVGVLTSVLVALTVVPMLLESDRRPRLAAAVAAPGSPMPVPAGGVDSSVSAEERNAPIPEGIDWEALRRAPETGPSCTPEDPTACVLVDGDGPHVALVGDSQAGMLVPMFRSLAAQHGLKLSVNTVPACSWRGGTVNKRVPKAQNDRCEEMRRDWYDDVLPVLSPDVVVLASGARDDKGYWGDRLVRSGGSDESLQELNLSTTLETVETIAAAGPRVLMLDTFPVTNGFEPLDCLASATRMSECQVTLPAESPASDAYNRVAAERIDDAWTLDLTDLFCAGAPVCLPIIDGVVVWKDQAHLSTEITLHRKDQVWERIQATGILAGL